MLGAEVPTAEAAVADDALHLLFALVRRVFLVVARWLLGHAAAERQSEVECGFAADGEVFEGGVGVGEVLAGEDETQI